MTSPVAAVPAAASPAALAHFESSLQFETDCWDVHHSLTTGQRDFVILDVRAPEASAAGRAVTAGDRFARRAAPDLGDNRRVNYALFDDAGKFLAGRVMSEADSSIQVELESGKRVKVKSSHVLLRFEKPQPAELIAQGQALAREIDLDLAWECASDGEFGFAALARDYFDA